MSTNLHLFALGLRYQAGRLKSLVHFELQNTSVNYPGSIGRMLHVQSIVEVCKDIISNLLQSK